MKPLKMKKCRNCLTEFRPMRSLQVTCSMQCAINYTREHKEKTARRQEKRVQSENRKEQRMARERLRSRSDHLALAQMAFNKYIRLRDKGNPCISCGTEKPDIQYAAGHYRSVGAAPELRFCEDNVHLQCNKNCNGHRSGNAIEYRIGLIKKIGVERVEWLEGPHDPLRLTIDEIKELKAKYSKLAKQLEQQNG